MSVSEAIKATEETLRLLDSILTWSDLSKKARENLTEAANHLELAGTALSKSFAGLPKFDRWSEQRAASEILHPICFPMEVAQ